MMQGASRNGARATNGQPPILSLRGIRVEFGGRSALGRRREQVVAADDVSLEIAPGEIVALIGASGSGKTTTVRAALGLQPVSAGEVLFSGRPLASLGAAELKSWRRRIHLVFQDPSEALNPRMTVEAIVMEGLAIHRLGANRAARLAMIADALAFVELAPAERFLGRHPHTLSGGQRQRVAIAAALVLSPDLLVADEPVSMLDPSIRAGILDLFGRLRATRGMSLLMVTHDLPSACRLADRVYVMHRGRIVEQGDAGEVFRAPRHDYTRMLIDAVAGGLVAGRPA